jgi:glycogen debranching enzyme
MKRLFSLCLLCWTLPVLAQTDLPFVPIDPNVWQKMATPKLTGLWPQDLIITVKPGEVRSFILANRRGTYFYGSTNESGWDSGWMGLWANRKRVLDKFSAVDSAGNKLDLSKATCKITPFDVTWSWKKPQRELTIFFPLTTSDSLRYSGIGDVRVAENPYFVPAVRDTAFNRSLQTWLLSSSSEQQPPADYLPDKIRTELSSSYFHCNDERFSQAVAWAHLQLLYLLAENDSLLYAGIPWFNEGWGRDTFISLPGLLMTGHADIAKKLLTRFGNWLDRDPQSPTYGRIPNRVRPGEEIAYNTADGTPWWILGIYYYGLYAHDYDFWTRMTLAPDSVHEAGPVLIALSGALTRCDSLGFLTHGDGDTWMDAFGPRGAVTPRGDRAVEITALHYASLDAAMRMISYARDKRLKDSLKVWRVAVSKIEQNFLSNFVAPTQDRLYDHLNANGIPDTLLRPNQLFALTVPLVSLLPPELRTKITATVCKNLVHDYGVLSLSPKDANFHPFHMDEHYPKDDAYHTGIVWTWLSGPAKTALRMEGRADLALQMANYEVNLIQNRGCAGSLPEVTDAMPRKGKKEVALSGTATQAWSLAEFLRTTYQDILGIRPLQVPGHVEPFWLFDPRIPKEWGETYARVALEGTAIFVTMQNYGDSVAVILKAESAPAKPIGVKFFDEMSGVTGYLNGTEEVRVVYVPKSETIFADGKPTAKLAPRRWPYKIDQPQIELAKPITRTDFLSLKPPPWEVLTAKETYWDEKKFGTVGWNGDVIAIGADTVGDDTTRYMYPLDEHFKPGILDIKRFDITKFGHCYFFRLWFRNLVNPGWHPEYGFQLTYAAICLHTPNAKRTDVDANSNYVFPDSTKFSRIIYVGGGLRIEDDNHKVLAEFTPRTKNEAIADTTYHMIRFSLPSSYFPLTTPEAGWTVLVGAQDDHGGAGMGEFRNVKAVVEQWAGGGNTNYGPNVYDVLYIPEKAKRPKVTSPGQIN